MKKILYIQIFILSVLYFPVNVLAANSLAANNDTTGNGRNVALINNSVPGLHSNIKDEVKNIDIKQILAEVTSITTGEIGKMTGLFSGKNPDWKWIVQEGALPENINASTTLTKEGAVTTLDYNKLRKATKLSVARTIIHELVHTYITLYFSNDPLNASFDFPLISLAWQRSEKPDYNEIQHAQMELSFVGDIAIALKEYGESIGLLLNDTIYTDLAWGGLDFQGSSQLKEADKQRIQFRLSAEQLNTTVFNINPVGPGMF